MEIEPEYDYDDDYGDLFTTFVLNITSDEEDNASFRDWNNLTGKQRQHSVLKHDEGWLFTINVISGIGILTNSILVFMIIVDFVIDKERRFWTRHWLLLNTSITHVAFLGIGVYMREFRNKLADNERMCLIIQHTDKTMEFVIILYLIVLSINIIGHILLPRTPCLKRDIIFWIFFVLFIMVCGNLAIMGLFTMKVEQSSKPDDICELDATWLLRADNIHLITIVTFFVPYGIVLICAFSSLLCSCVQQRKSPPSLPADDESNSARKHSVVFIFLTSTIGFLLFIPFYTYQVPELSAAILEVFRIDHYIVYYLTLLVKLMYYILFPVLCLCLQEIRSIYHKAVST